MSCHATRLFDDTTQAGRDRRSLATYLASILFAIVATALLLAGVGWLVGPIDAAAARERSHGWTVLMLDTHGRAIATFPCDAEPHVQGELVLFETEGGVKRFLDRPWAVVPPGL